MKKIIFSILIAGGLLTSCDMNELPAGSISDETAIQTVQDAMKFRNGIYNDIRYLTGGRFVSYPDIQADQFIATQRYENRIGLISSGSIDASLQDYEDFWALPYQNIAAVNYFLPKVDALLDRNDLTEENEAALHQYKGEAHWARAYYYYFLADKYCNSYTVINPQDANTGVPLVTTYEPSGDYASYPGRSSLEETFAQIENDLNVANTELEIFEKSAAGTTQYLAANSAYLSTNSVKALQARIALLKGEWQTAATLAQELIDCGKFTLATGDDYFNMWYTDESSELIFVPFGNNDQSDGIGATGSAWLSNNQGVYDYIVSSSAINLYDQVNDIRYESFIVPGIVSVGGENITCPCFYKFPGNPSLNTNTSNAFKNKPKPFRLSEMYLIVAEAAANFDEAKANTALNTLRRARITGYTDQTLAGNALRNEIRNERAKELIGEGFRISDLRRWGLGFSRGYAYTGEFLLTPDALVPASRDVVYQAGYYKYVLPIPTNELETNPQIAGHQNPCY